jgi:hypothetical protein
MSYTTTRNKSQAPQSAIIPVTELDRILDEYQAAMRKTAELVRINDERDRLFNVMKENFDILFEEVEQLKVEVSENMVLIDRLNKEIHRLKTLKNIKKRLNQHKSDSLAVDFEGDI